MNTGKRIKERRLELGLSVDELADKLGKNRATIYRYESNEIENFPVGILEPLAKELKTIPAFLMGWTDEKSPNDQNPESLIQEEMKNIFTDCTKVEQEKIIQYAKSLVNYRKSKEALDSVEREALALSGDTL